MRRRRDPFARETYVPRVVARAGERSPVARGGCVWCGQLPAARRPLYQVCVEPDGGRDNVLDGQFCSWTCAETYHHGARIGR